MTIPVHKKSKKYLTWWMAILSIFCISSAHAEQCQPTTWQAAFGETVQINKKVKVNAVCTLGTRSGAYEFTGITLIDSPKGIFQIVDRPYEFAFRITKLGKYNVKIKQNFRDRYGKEQFIIFDIKFDVVSDSW